MSAKRKDTPVAATGRTNKRRRGSASCRGRRTADANYQPRQTRSRAAMLGASPLAVLADKTKARRDTQGKRILDSMERNEPVSAGQEAPALRRLSSSLAEPTVEFPPFEREGAPSPEPSPSPSPEPVPSTIHLQQAIPTLILSHPSPDNHSEQLDPLGGDEWQNLNTSRFEAAEEWDELGFSTTGVAYEDVVLASYPESVYPDWSMFRPAFSFAPKAEPSNMTRSPPAHEHSFSASKTGVCNMCGQVCGRLDHRLLGFHSPVETRGSGSKAQEAARRSEHVPSRKRKRSTNSGGVSSGSDTAPAWKRLKLDLFEETDAKVWHVPQSSDSDSSDSIEIDAYLDLKMKASGGDPHQHEDTGTSLSPQQSGTPSNSSRTSYSADSDEEKAGSLFDYAPGDMSPPTSPLSGTPYFADEYTGRNSPSYTDSDPDQPEDEDIYDDSDMSDFADTQRQSDRTQEDAVIDAIIGGLLNAVQAKQDGYDGDLDEEDLESEWEVYGLEA